jgi:hypothetical protein
LDNAVNIITNPYEDVSLAKKVLYELEAVLHRNGCQLVHVADATVLARIVDNSNSVHIAKIFEIVPGKIQAKLAWREIINETVIH